MCDWLQVDKGSVTAVTCTVGVACVNTFILTLTQHTHTHCVFAGREGPLFGRVEGWSAVGKRAVILCHPGQGGQHAVSTYRQSPSLCSGQPKSQLAHFSPALLFLPAIVSL